jgi:Zn-dependent protease with chaperone function
MITTASFAILSTASLVIQCVKYKKEADEPSHAAPSHHHEHIHRAREILRPLCERNNIPEPHIVISPEPFANAFMLDRLRGKDILTLTETLLQTLDDRELEGIIAHELAHQNRWYSRVRELTSLVSTLTKPIATWGTMALAFSALAPTTGSIVASTLAFGASMLATTSAAIVLGLWCNYISRYNEIKTDLRACAITGDPEALITALSKIEPSSPDFRKVRDTAARLGLLSHPIWEERAKHIRRAFGTSA